VASRVVARDNVSILAATCKIYQGILILWVFYALALRDAVAFVADRG
jgi:hypothetical protein